MIETTLGMASGRIVPAGQRARRGAAAAALGLALMMAPGAAPATAGTGEPGLALAAPAGVVAPPLHLARSRAGLFGAVEAGIADPGAIPQWRGAARRIERERPQMAACDGDPRQCRSPRVTAWLATLRALRGREPLAQLQALNDFANAVVAYRPDIDAYGASDYWAAPLELLGRGGDCEDFAILKFVSLLELGFSNDQMRIAVVQDRLADRPHAVLAVAVGDETYILDSLFDIVLPHRLLDQYVPIYSVNLTMRWAHAPIPEPAGDGRQPAR